MDAYKRCCGRRRNAPAFLIPTSKTHAKQSTKYGIIHINKPRSIVACLLPNGMCIKVKGKREGCISTRSLCIIKTREDLSERITWPEGEPEMTPFESAFLCGVLREFRPNKIVEVGIAGGGTSAIISSCMCEMCDDFELE